MFTGIVQGLGEIVALDKKGGECRLTLRPLFVLLDIADGESIAVNGACLSVETHNRDSFTAYASAETLSRTLLGGLAHGSQVNLERALALGERLGGHLVSGHVDCLATVTELRPSGQSFVYRLTFPEEFAVEVIYKGSVALDGVSLTVNACGKDFLEANVIPDTRRRTAIRYWRPGTRVNMETDMIGKYVRRLLEARNAPAASGGGLNREFLLENGFL
ncbi:riboflavin synthase [Candidatus Desulfovibrio trichonymphae]|uniref:Riboflavin synthase n=1 Tax=Candidatus Desulfovibrio trichonymphae TaxID=1725232 RepID=A0A1J1DYZ0_9BACT|nr:riboflavin synthase [Candidatus Desulfovibrio trichonymphae]BAV92350.1 riboflavin synthase [Candidatus Desulfovibrio trichonymphae]GHU90731.1 riboflavin synthase subunit alpha [Deltaproteobacteria bacterium]GHU98033.1 riboflavin synthase subunit alpha [Deltaproteobacteria bacterium]